MHRGRQYPHGSYPSSVTTTLNGLLAILGTSVTAGPINLGTDIAVAQASATLDTLQCPNSKTSSPVATLSAQPNVATITFGTFSGAATSAPPLDQSPTRVITNQVKAIAGLASANLYVYMNGPVSTTVGSNTNQPLPLPVNSFTKETSPPLSSSAPPTYIANGIPPNAAVAGNPQTIGSSNLLTGAFSTLSSSLSGNLSTGSSTSGSSICILFICVPVSGLLNPLLTGVTSTLSPILTGTGELVDTLLNPLLQLLGLQVGTATVVMQGVTVARPAITTECLPGFALPRGCPTDLP